MTYMIASPASTSKTAPASMSARVDCDRILIIDPEECID